MIENTAQNDEVSLKEIVQKLKAWLMYLRSKWMAILIVATLGGILGLAYSIVKKPVYTASLSFAMEEQGTSMGGALSLASQFGFDLGNSGGGAFSGDNLIELMMSRSIIEKTLMSPVEVDGKKFSLAELYIQFNGLRQKWAEKKGVENIQFAINQNPDSFNRLQDSLISDFYKQITKSNLTVIKRDKKLDIIDVEGKFKNEIFAKSFTENLVSVVAEFYTKTKTKKSYTNLSILQHQTDSVKNELNKSINGVASATDVNPNLNPTRQVLRVPSQQKQVNVQANTAILTELVKNLEMSKIALRKETPLIQIIDKPVLPLDERKMGKVVGFFIGFIIMGVSASLYLMMLMIYKGLTA